MVEVPQNMYFEAPEEMTPPQRARDAIVTALLWAVYLYLWVPLISLLAWALGFEFAYDVMVRAGGARDLLPILLEYAVVISMILSAFTIWSVSNRLRFKNLSRRSRRQPVSDDALSEYWGLPLGQIRSMRAHQIIRVSFDAEDNPVIQTYGVEELIDEYGDWSIDDHGEDDQFRATGWN